MFPSEHASKSSATELYELIGGFSGFIYYLFAIIAILVLFKFFTRFLRNMGLNRIAAGIDLAFLYATVFCLLAGVITGLLVVPFIEFIRRYNAELVSVLKGVKLDPMAK